MKTFKPVSGHMIEQPLHRHHLYSCARSLLVERFPDLVQQCKVLSRHSLTHVVPLADICSFFSGSDEARHDVQMLYLSATHHCESTKLDTLVDEDSD